MREQARTWGTAVDEQVDAAAAAAAAAESQDKSSGTQDEGVKEQSGEVGVSA